MIHGISIKQFVKDLNKEISDDNVFNGAAALGYYFTLAIFPAMILVMTIIPYLPVQNVDKALMDLLGQALPGEASSMLTGVVREVTSSQHGGLLSFGILATLWAASSGMYAIMQQLNVTYDVKEQRSFLKARGIALGLSLLFGLLVIGAFTLIVLGGVIQDWLGSHFGFSSVLLVVFSLFRWVVIVAALLLGFALIYKLGPDVEQKFSFVTPGSAIGVALLVVASLGFAIYTRNFADYSKTYGSIGAVIILMLWLYVAGLVILTGSEINALIEHYSPKGKRKGEKQEGERPGGRLAA